MSQSLQDVTVRFRTQRKTARDVDVEIKGSWIVVDRDGGDYWYPVSTVDHIVDTDE